MKQHILGFVGRGLVGCGFGPLVLVVFYLVMQHLGEVETLTVDQVCVGIVSLAGLGFMAGGMNEIYQIERLPLIPAILIHGGVLYLSYLVAYLLNGWLESGVTPILVFSGIFILGFFAIWAVIYSIIKRSTARINQILKEKQGIAQD